MPTKKQCFKLIDEISKEIYLKYNKGEKIDLGDGEILYEVPMPFGVWGNKKESDVVVIKNKQVIKSVEEANEYLKTIW